MGATVKLKPLNGSHHAGENLANNVLRISRLQPRCSRPAIDQGTVNPGKTTPRIWILGFDTAHQTGGSGDRTGMFSEIKGLHCCDRCDKGS